MTDPAKRLADMDRVGIDVEVISLSTPNVFFVEGPGQAAIAREVNDAYAELIARYPARFKGFASIPMDDPDAALEELHRAIDELKMNGVVLLSNIRGRALTSPVYRPFFEEANRIGLCIFLHPMLPANAAPFGEYVLGPLVGFPFDTTLAVARMCFDGLLRELPNIRWLIGHLGGAIPWLMERLDSGYRDFAECRAKIDAPPSTYLEAALLRHGHLQPVQPAPRARPRGIGPHGDGQRLSAPARLDRPRRLLDRTARHPRARKGTHLLGDRAVDPEQHLVNERGEMTSTSASFSRALGLFSLIAIAVNGVIGSGIFVLPATVAALMGAASPAAYIVAAALTALVVLCFAEAGSRFEETGGPYIYARTAFGRFVGFEVGWMFFLSRLAAAGAIANACAAYAANFWPVLGAGAGRAALLTAIIGGLAGVNVARRAAGRGGGERADDREARAAAVAAGRRAAVPGPGPLRSRAGPGCGRVARGQPAVDLRVRRVRERVGPGGRGDAPAP